MRLRFATGFGCGILVLAIAGPAAGEEEKRRVADAKADASAKSAVVYVPPPRGAPATRAGGGTRAPGALPELSVLAPDHVGRTARAAPTLFWFASAPAQARLELTLIREGEVEPRLEEGVATGVEAGVGSVSLGRWGIELEADAIYQWSIALVEHPTQRDRDVIASGYITRAALPPELADSPDEGSDPGALARHGLWYDALAELGRRIEAGDESLLETRAALLEQVGLDAAARYERARLR